MNRTSTFENPTILAIDASTEQCSVALLVNGNCTSKVCNTPRSHAKVILPLVDELLSQADISLKDVNVLAIGIGPGSFTGIRIGVGVAQGLAYGAQLPIYTRASLDILAFETAHKYPECSTVVASLDARMGEVYWGEYAITRDESTQVNIELTQAIAANGIEDFNRLVGEATPNLNESGVGVGHGWSVEGVQHNRVSKVDKDLLPTAESLVQLCLNDLQNNRANLQAYNSVLEPLYVRNEVAWEKRVRIRTTSVS